MLEASDGTYGITHGSLHISIDSEKFLESQGKLPLKLSRTATDYFDISLYTNRDSKSVIVRLLGIKFMGLSYNIRACHVFNVKTIRIRGETSLS